MIVTETELVLRNLTSVLDIPYMVKRLMECFIFGLLLSSMCYAETHQTLLRVRIIHASTPSVDVSSGVAQVSASLKDISSELTSLPFKKFTLLESIDRTVSMKEKETIKLSTGDKVSIRPHYVESGKLCFWFKWVDKNGSQILDSKLHVEKGKGVISGADSSEKEARLIALTLP